MPVDVQKVEEIFAEALTKADASVRSAYLDQACEGDGALRARVEALLEAHDAEGSLLNLPHRDGATAPFVQLSEQPGTTIGRFKLLEQIGEGGFGVVFMAEQAEPVRRLVALKIIKLGMDTRQIVARFEAERQALAMMDHPHVAKVLDGGATDAGRPYFVMELVKGTPITEYCDKNSLSIRQRLELFCQVCQAVQHAHQKGLIHRDIKPTNVLVMTQDDRPVAKVIDFGVAKAMQSRLTEKTLFTEYRQLVGTPAYMSPEQAAGDLDVDTRSDVYSLGVLLYELLAGVPPFDPQELRLKAFAELQRIICEVEPPAPSTRVSTPSDYLPSIAAHRAVEPRKLAAIVRGELDWIVMRCLEKDRKRRFQTANALAEDLQRYLADQPIEARPATRRYRFRKFVRRNKAGVLAASAVVAALAVGLALSTVGFLQAHRQEQIARVQAARSDQVAQFLKDMLEGVGPNVALGRDTAMLVDIVDKTAERIEVDLKDQPEVQVELGIALTQAYFELQNYNKMEQIARRTFALARRRLGEESLPAADAQSLLAGALMVLRRIDEAETNAREALSLQRRLREGDSVQEAKALQVLGAVLRHQSGRARGADGGENVREAEQVTRESLAIFRNRLGNDHDDVAWSLNQLSNVLSSAGKRREAAEAIRESAAIRRRIHGDLHPYLASDYRNLAGHLKGLGQLDEAEKYAREALAIGQKMGIQGKNSEVWTHYVLANILTARSKLDEAETHRREVVTIARRQLGPDYPDLPQFLCSLAATLRQNGKLDEARAAAEEAIAVCKRNPTSIPHLDQNAAYATLASILAARGDAAALELHVNQWIGDAELSGDDDRVANAIERAIPILFDNGRREQAMNLCRKLITLQARAPAPFNQAAWLLATTPNAANRDPALAVELAKKAIELQPNSGLWWNTLGAAQYRSGNWQAASEAFDKSMALRHGGDANDWFFVAMVRWQLNDKEQARQWYDKAFKWMEREQPQNAELIRFRAEAAELLGVITLSSPDSTPHNGDSNADAPAVETKPD